MDGRIVGILITWIPILMLVIGVGIGILVGLIRGFRKNLILAIQAAAAALICLIAYLIIINMKGLDAWAFNQINSISQGALVDAMELSAGCNTLTDALIEFIPKNMDFGDGMNLVLMDNGAYLATLVDLCYHMIFALVFYIIYGVLVFILYIVYFIFYPERRYKKKIKEKYRKAEITKDYTKRSLFGGLVGGVRALIEYCVVISFVGALFFTLGGGLGNKKYEDYDFGDDNTNTIYDVYTAIGSYGTSGIFKVLNAAKDSNDFPYYLYVADLVFQGGLNDENRNINTNISMTREFGSYVGFSRDAFNLVLKYDENNKIKDVIKGNSDVEIMDVVSEIMLKKEFQDEFSLLIDKFESEEYFINFALSLVDSIVAHRKDLSFFEGVDADTMELLDILFEGENKITVSNLINKDDAKVLLNTCIKMLSAGSEYNDIENEEEKSLRQGLAYCKVIIPELEKLSLFTDEARKNSLNGVLAELYDYLSSKFASQENSGELSMAKKAMKLANTTIDEVDWIEELKGLLDIGLSVVDLYGRIYTPDKEIIDIIFDMFKGDDALKNEEDFDNIVNVISSSKLAGVVLSMSFVNDAIEEALGQMIEGFELLPDIRYNNEGDTKGEIYYLLTSIKHLIKNDAKDVFTELTKEDATTSDMLNAVSNLVEKLNSNIDSNTTLLDQMLKSDLLTYTLSSIMLNLDLGEDISIYVPEEYIYNIRQKEDKDFKAINTAELSNLVSTLPDVIDIIDEAMDEDEKIDLMKVLNSDNLTNSLKTSVILEGTISNLALTMLKDFEEITLPNALSNVDAWLSTDSEDGEIVKIIDGVNASGIDLNSLMNSGDDATNDILDLVLSLNELAPDSSETKLNLLYKSLVLRATLTTQIDNVITEMIDENVINSTEVKYQTNDEFKDIYYKEEEIAGVIDSINVLDIESLDSEAFNADVIGDKVLTLNEASSVSGKTKLDVLYSSSIIKYVLTDALDDVLTTDIISNTVRESSLVKEEKDIINVKTAVQNKAKNYKKSEISSVIKSLNELEITTLDSTSLNADVLSDKVLTLNDKSVSDNTITKLDVLYSSTVIKYILVKTLDDVLTTDIISNTVRESSLVKSDDEIALSNSTYYKKSEISSVIKSLNELEITTLDSTSLNADVLSDKVLTLNDKSVSDNTITKLDVLYSSVVIKYVLAEAVNDNLAPSKLGVNEEVVNSIKLNDELESVYYYKKSEIKLLLDALGENGLDVDTIDSLTTADANIILEKNVNEIPTGQSETRLAVIYKSVLVKDVITSKLDDTLLSNTLVVVDPLAKQDRFNDSIYFYNQSEIGILIDFMKKHSSTELDAIDIATMVLDSTDIDSIIGSHILYATTSKHIIDNSSLIKPTECILVENGISKISTVTEMEGMLNAIITICGGRVNSSVDLSLSDSSINALCSSAILRATISDKVINNAAVITPQATIDSSIESVKTINSTELNALLNAVLNGLGVTNVEEFDTDSISIPTSDKLDILTNSSIMRATISKNIKASDGTNPLTLYVENNSLYVEKAKSANNSDILVLTKEEIINIVNAIKIINGESSSEFDIELSIEVLVGIMELDSTKIDTALQSSMVHLLVANFLTDYYESTPALQYLYSYTPQSYNVYNINTIENTQAYSTMSKDDIKGLLNKLVEQAGSL